MVADSSIVDQSSLLALSYCKMQELKLLMLSWGSFTGRSDEVIERVFAYEGGW